MRLRGTRGEGRTQPLRPQIGRNVRTLEPVKRSDRRHRRRALLAIAAAAVVAGAIALGLGSGGGGPSGKSAAERAQLAERASSTPSPSELTGAAAYLGVSTEQLAGELRSGRTLAEIAGARPGRSAAGLEDALLAAKVARIRTGSSGTARSARIIALRRRIADQVSGIRPYIGLPESARYLGVSVARLARELRSGRSLAQIADATRGRSAAGLIDARVRSREAKLRASLAAGKLTKSNADALLASLRQRVSAEVHRTDGS